MLRRKTIGINVQKDGISNVLEELVIQPLLVSVSVLTLATETVWPCSKPFSAPNSDVSVCLSSLYVGHMNLHLLTI